MLWSQLLLQRFVSCIWFLDWFDGSGWRLVRSRVLLVLLAPSALDEEKSQETTNNARNKARYSDYYVVGWVHWVRRAGRLRSRRGFGRCPIVLCGCTSGEWRHPEDQRVTKIRQGIHGAIQVRWLFYCLSVLIGWIERQWKDYLLVKWTCRSGNKMTVLRLLKQPLCNIRQSTARAY